jgi:transposase InsO family protein
MDFIIDLLESRDPQTQVRHNSILVIVDRLIKYAYFWLYRKDTHTKGLVFTFLRIIVANYGLPKEIILDRDRLFTSKFWKALVAELGIKHRMSTAYHPQIDG